MLSALLPLPSQCELANGTADTILRRHASG
jgi:hypothetical protein